MHHLHQNLLYGYDDKKKIFMAAGYENSGKLHTYTVSYSDMMAILKQNINLVIKVITYHQGFRFYRFVPEYIQEDMHRLSGRKKYGATAYAVHFCRLKERVSRNRNIPGTLYPDQGINLT